MYRPLHQQRKMSNLRVNELEDEELRYQFNFLLEAMEDIVTVDPNREERVCEELNQRIQQEVTDKPILACIVSAESNQSLLSTACRNLNLGTSHDTIKCLIQAYPSALLGTPEARLNRLYAQIPIYMIVNHQEHCVLLPWIATNHTWILNHDSCLEYPPVIDLIKMYATRRPNSCTSATIKDFFVAYPRAFTQKRGSMTILLFVLKGTRECEADLFMWMAERCPSRYLLETDSDGRTPLHHACRSLSTYKGRDSCEICKYLIDKCPASVRAPGIDDILPIHFLLSSHFYQLVREVIVCLLREYPESYDVRASDGLPPSSKFILDEEKELKETAASLMDSTSSLTKASSCTNDKLMRSASTVFDSWATSFINTTDNKLESISVKLQEMCNEGRESDE